MSDRCSPLKHVIEKGQPFCDCKKVMIAPTAGKNALVVRLLDPIQEWALGKMGDAA